MLMPSSSRGIPTVRAPRRLEGLDRPVVARLLRIDCGTGLDEIGRDEILQLQRNRCRSGSPLMRPHIAGQFLAQRRVARLLTVLQHDAGFS